MRDDIIYTPAERFWLWTVAGFGFFGVNGAFVYGLIFRPEALGAAMTNPIAAAFIVEALVLVALLAYLFTKWRVGRLSWAWFVFLSLLGGLAFSIPVVLLFSGRRGEER